MYVHVYGCLSDKIVSCQNSYCNTTSQSVLVSFTTHMAHPTFKTETLHTVSNVQLVKGLLLRNEWDIYSITLLFFNDSISTNDTFLL